MLGAYRRAIDRAVSSFMGEVGDRDLTRHLDGPSDDAWLGEKLFTALAPCSNRRISRFHPPLLQNDLLEICRSRKHLLNRFDRRPQKSWVELLGASQVPQFGQTCERRRIEHRLVELNSLKYRLQL
jgi:hypothetical protein